MRCLMALEGALGLGGGQAKQKGFADNIAGEKVVVTIRKDEGEKDEERLRGDGGREPVRERESCGDNERGRERGRGNRDRESEPERERSYRGREPERERSGSHREREVDREPRHRQRDKMTRQREAEGRVKDRDGGETKCESPPQERKRALEEGSPAIVLEVLKEGKIISKVEIPDLKCNQRCSKGWTVLPLSIPPIPLIQSSVPIPFTDFYLHTLICLPLCFFP